MKYEISNQPFTVLTLRMEASCKMDIQTIKGFTNVLLGGEGLFNTVVTGPGKVWLQTMPVTALAMNLYAYMPHPSN